MPELSYRWKKKGAFFLCICVSTVGTLLLFDGLVTKYSYYPTINAYVQRSDYLMVKNSNYPRIIEYSERKPVFAIGILSFVEFPARRDAVRKTWLSLRQYTPFDIKYKFLLDRPTVSSEKENGIHGDIIYLNASTSQYALEFADKVKSWFEYALEAYPEAGLIAKLDDDVYPCVRVFARIYDIMTNDLYYGFKHNVGRHELNIATRIDEMFVVLGRLVVEKFVTVTICRNKTHTERACNFADCAIGEWMGVNNIKVNQRNDNNKIAHFDRFTRFSSKMFLLNLTKSDFCQDNFLFHKSSPSLMHKLAYLDRKRLNINTETLIAVEFKTNKVKKADTIPSCKIWCVAMAKEGPSAIIHRIASLKSWCLVIVGDQYSLDKNEYIKKLHNYRPDFVYFLSPKDHEHLFPELSQVLPWDHFSRMNIGFMFAIKHKAKFIYGIDLIELKINLTMSYILNRHEDYLNQTMNIGDADIFKLATDTNGSIHITKSSQFYNTSQNKDDTHDPLYTELCTLDYDKTNNSRLLIGTLQSVDLSKSWPSDVENFKLPSHNFCFSRSKVPVGSLKFVPYKQYHRVNSSFENDLVPYVSRHDVGKVLFETFWFPSVFNHIALPISNSFVQSRTIQQQIINHALRQNGVKTVYIPVPWKTITMSFLNDTRSQNRTRQDIEFDTTKLSLQNETDLESVFMTLYRNEIINYDNIGLSRAWSSTIDSIYRSFGTEIDKGP